MTSRCLLLAGLLGSLCACATEDPVAGGSRLKNPRVQQFAAAEARGS